MRRPGAGPIPARTDLQDDRAQRHDGGRGLAIHDREAGRRLVPSGFSDAAWKKGLSGFGSHSIKNAHVRTEWKTPDIWIRRTIELPSLPQGELYLSIYHDDDAEVYINGVPAASFHGYLTHYEEAPISPAAVKSLRPGKNVIAIHCHQVYRGPVHRHGHCGTAEVTTRARKEDATRLVRMVKQFDRLETKKKTPSGKLAGAPKCTKRSY